MDRRRILLIVAVIVALLGTALVFLYVRGADARANERFDTVNVLQAVAPIEAGESIDDAAASGKLALQPVAEDYLLPNYQTSVEALSGSVATVRILPGEQIVSDKFGAAAEVEGGSALTIPKGMIAISVSLSDTARVAGFINPGTNVAIFLNGTDPAGATYTRLLVPEVQVIGVGSTTTTQTTTTTPEGTADDRAAAADVDDAGARAARCREGAVRPDQRRARLRRDQRRQRRQPGTRHQHRRPLPVM